MQPDRSTPVSLTIAGSDSGGGAGIQADLRTFAALGVFGTSAITCLTAQNPDSVTDVMPCDPAFLREQMLQIGRFFSLGAVKTGMLFSAELIREVAAFLRDRPNLPAVVDPVMVATSGAVLLKPDAIEVLREELLPLARVVTPNLDEAAILLDRSVERKEEMIEAAKEMSTSLGCAVLLKGGHLRGDEVRDVLAAKDGTVEVFDSNRINKVDTHGSGCTLSAAIAAQIAQGADLSRAVAGAREYLRNGMANALPLCREPRRFINHFPPMQR